MSRWARSRRCAWRRPWRRWPEPGVGIGARGQDRILVGPAHGLGRLGVELRVAEARPHVREVHARHVHRLAAQLALGFPHGLDQRLDLRFVARCLPVVQQPVERAAQDGHDRDPPSAQPALQVEHLELDGVLVAVHEFATVGAVAEPCRHTVHELGVARDLAERRLEALASQCRVLVAQVMPRAEHDDAQRGRILGAHLEVGPCDDVPLATRVQVRRQHGARQRVAGGSRRAGLGQVLFRQRELLVEVLLEQVRLGRVTHPIQRGWAHFERVVLLLRLLVGGFEARRVQQQHLVELGDELSDDVAHAQVLALAHHHRLDVGQGRRAIEHLEDGDGLEAQHRPARGDAERIADHEQLALAIAHRGDLHRPQPRILRQVVVRLEAASRRKDDARLHRGLGVGSGHDQS
jgi:hypothetical protein